MKDKTKKIIWAVVAVVILLFIAKGFFGNSYPGMFKSSSLNYDMSMNEISNSDSAFMPMMATQEKRAYSEEMGMDFAGDWDDGGVVMVEQNNIDRKLEKRVSLNVVIEDKEAFINKTKELTEFYKGYWQNYYDNNSEYSPSVSVDIKIPIDQLEHFLKDIKENIDYLENENLFVNDVTLEFTDLKARLDNAKKEETQYLVILEKAYDIEDILSVTSYLNRVRERIEVMQAQMNAMSNRTDYSVVNIYARVLSAGETVTEEWSLSQTWKEAVNDLIRNTKFFIEGFVYSVVTNIAGIIFWVIIALIAYIIYRKKFRK